MNNIRAESYLLRYLYPNESLVFFKDGRIQLRLTKIDNTDVVLHEWEDVIQATTALQERLKHDVD